MMKPVLFAATMLLFGLPLSAQTQTQTNCNVNGNQVNCTSTDNSAANAASAQQQKDIDASMNALGSAIGQGLAQKREDKKIREQVIRILDYCGSHPDSNILTVHNKEDSCTHYVKLISMVCIKYPKESPCKHIPSMPSAVASSTAPSTTASTSATATVPTSPPPTATSAAVTAQSIPAAERTQEQRDAGAYCQRNPTATITWSNGTVSPCSSVLAAP